MKEREILTWMKESKREGLDGVSQLIRVQRKNERKLGF
jgi:hypothetical protein